MFDIRILNKIKRKTIVTGHYGSGKTEFTISIALQARHLKNCTNFFKPHVMPLKNQYDSLAIIDLDVINPYFRSREQRDMLKEAGVEVYGSAFDTEVTAELPALGANLRAPLENKSYKVFIDTGGNDTGAIVLNQFGKYFNDDDTTVLAVINANRPDTNTIENAIEHIEAIEYITKLKVSAVVNNTHMLRETTADDIKEGHMFCEEICKITSKYLLCDCYPEGIVNPDDLTGLSENLMPIGLYMRPTWLDK